MPDRMARTDVLLVSIGGTAGLRAADGALAGALRRAGASVAVARVASTREVRTFALTDLAWALPARAAARAAVRDAAPRAIVYSSSTAALLWPERGAIRFDAPAAGNRPGRHGIWQRPVERRRFAEATLLLPWSEGALAEAPSPRADALVVPVPVAASGPAAGARDLAAITYGANPHKKGTDRVLAAWGATRRRGPASRACSRPPGTARCCAAPARSSPRPAARTSGSRSSRRSPTARSSSPPPRPAPTPRSRSPARWM